VKGYVRGFSIESDTVVLNDQKTLQEIRVPIAELKAIFFVKNFGGSSKHVERKLSDSERTPAKRFLSSSATTKHGSDSSRGRSPGTRVFPHSC